MLKKTVTYTDYNGVERTETHYFNINKAEAFNMEMGVTGGYSEMINKMIEAQESAELLKLIQEFVLKAYGVKSADGKQFIKSPEISKAFSETEAFVEIYMELFSSDVAMANFVNGVLPNNVQKQQSSN